VATLSRWIVLLSGKQHIDDIRKASDEELSFIEATEEAINFTAHRINTMLTGEL
jgi:hypothetical protein